MEARHSKTFRMRAPCLVEKMGSGAQACAAPLQSPHDHAKQTRGENGKISRILWNFGRFCTNFPGNSMKLFAQCMKALRNCGIFKEQAKMEGLKMAKFPRILWNFGRFCINFPGNSMNLFGQCSGLLKNYITLHTAAAEEIIKITLHVWTL